MNWLRGYHSVRSLTISSRFGGGYSPAPDIKQYWSVVDRVDEYLREHLDDWVVVTVDDGEEAEVRVETCRVNADIQNGLSSHNNTGSRSGIRYHCP